jgi:SAM-dependent methyltransferase
METWAVTNEEQARYWNGDEAAHWLVHEQRYERMLAPFTDHLLTAAAIGRADRVVDVGCGTGSTTRAAGRAAIEGGALGVDLSTAMLRQAARRAQEEGLANVRFERGDAQVHRFTPGAGDVAIEPIAEPLWMGPDVADTIAFLRSTGIWNSLLRDADPPTVARVSQAVQAALEPYVTPDGVQLGSRAWLVTASRPWQASGP